MTAEKRTKRELEVRPEGQDDGTLPLTFRLTGLDTPQRRDGRTRGRWVSTAPAERVTLAEGITRAEAVELIRQLADWLAWDGVNG